MGPAHNQETRRDFFRSAVRNSLAAALAGAAGLGLWRGRVTGQTCVSDGRCARCQVLARCGLPQALSARQVLGKAARGGIAKS